MICFPLDNTEYSAVAPGSYLSSRTRGVFSAEENLQVYPAGGMDIAVGPGIAWLKKAEFWGVSAYSEREELRAIAAADGRLARIDAVCLRLDKTLNKAEIVIKQGEPAASPVAAPIERSSNCDELYLATVRVGAGVYTITQADITDQRLNEAYCGLMRDGVTGIPTAQLYEQAEAMLEMIRAELANINSGAEAMLRTTYDPQGRATDVFEYTDEQIRQAALPQTGTTNGWDWEKHPDGRAVMHTVVSIGNITTAGNGGYINPTSVPNPTLPFTVTNLRLQGTPQVIAGSVFVYYHTTSGWKAWSAISRPDAAYGAVSVCVTATGRWK